MSNAMIAMGMLQKVGILSPRLSVFVKVFLLRFKCPKSLQISKPRNASQLKSPAFLQELEDCRRNLSTRVQILSGCRLANRVSFEVCWHLICAMDAQFTVFQMSGLMETNEQQKNVDVPKPGNDRPEWASCWSGFLSGCHFRSKALNSLRDNATPGGAEE